MRDKLVKFFVDKVLRPRWVVCTDNGEMGLRVLGVNLWYYKWPEPMVAPSYPWKVAGKREFGETVKSQIRRGEKS